MAHWGSGAVTVRRSVNDEQRLSSEEHPDMFGGFIGIVRPARQARTFGLRELRSLPLFEECTERDSSELVVRFAAVVTCSR